MRVAGYKYTATERIVMYINENYNNYKYLVEPHDNYVILSNKSHISGSSGDADLIPVVYNYYYPSVSLPGTYSSEQSFSFTSLDLSNNIEDRADFPLIFICGFIIIYTLIFLINQLTKLVRKGGVFN